MSYQKQHELGIIGLALLRTWLIGDEGIALKVLKEAIKLTGSLKNSPLLMDVNSFDMHRGYESWAITYDNLPNLLIEIEEPIVKSLLKKFSPGRALDAGCGTGRYSKFLHTLGYSVTGVDLSKDMLRKARVGAAQINFLEGDLEALPIENNSMDLAISALALTHLPDIKVAISELARTLKNGGHVVISDIHPWLIILGGQADFYDKDGKYGYVRNYTHWHSSYIQAFKENGLKIVQCVEPTLEAKHIKLASQGFDLSAPTVSVALKGLPIALIWVLKKE
ncbi:MAG: class I SAM-dependent methyltransferase [Candidatus Levybacteria bacterium]|nr:class I SAM-dependent methyltransferase [Candidatus Levybacteria bacterium]